MQSLRRGDVSSWPSIDFYRICDCVNVSHHKLHPRIMKTHFIHYFFQTSPLNSIKSIPSGPRDFLGCVCFKALCTSSAWNTWVRESFMSLVTTSSMASMRVHESDGPCVWKMSLNYPTMIFSTCCSSSCQIPFESQMPWIVLRCFRFMALVLKNLMLQSPSVS